MHGNVWEWCQDTYHEGYEKAPIDGTAWMINNENYNRLLRGGSWGHDPEDCRSAIRNRFSPDNDDNYVGFRVVCGPAQRILSS